MNEKRVLGFTMEDCYIPEETRAYCSRGHDITEENCLICGIDLVEEDEVGCVIKRDKVIEKKKAPDGHIYDEETTYEERVLGHICLDCYQELEEEAGDGSQ